MSALYVLGGEFKGFKINVISHNDLRPTSVMLRRKVFDAHQDLRDYSFVDCFAGTGAVGLEAISRGAKHVYMIEFKKVFFVNVKQNIARLKNTYIDILKENNQTISLVSSSIENYLLKFKKIYLSWTYEQQQKCILFWDPPYENNKLYRLLTIFFEQSWFIGFFWIESDSQKSLSQKNILDNKLILIKEYKSSRQLISICRFDN